MSLEGGGEGTALKAPFPREPYFGGKRAVAPLIWERLGDCDNVIEPFCGSAAFLLARPFAPKTETINDADCMVANFWRSTQYDPDRVAEFADSPVNEADLHARHRWLVGISATPAPSADTPYLHALSGDRRQADGQAEFRRRMRTDPEFFDARIAGWWAWGLCCWIGGGWCTSHGETVDGDRKQERPVLSQAGKGVTKKGKVPAEKDLKSKLRIEGDNPGSRGKGVHAKGPTSQVPDLSGDSGASGRGVHASAGHKSRKGSRREATIPASWDQKPELGNWNAQNRVNPASGGRPQLADAYDIGRGVNSHGEFGTCAARREWLVNWFRQLRDRLRLVRVCCGDWRRVCDSDSVTVRLGTTGIFFDPPYGAAAGRDMNLYAVESGTVAADVRDYCLERGSDPRYRICLAGYEGEGHEALERAGWSVVAWKAHGGYGNRSQKGRTNSARERLWFSPHCLAERQPSLF